MKADLAIYTHVLGVPGQYESVALMLSHKMDFNCCANRDGFRTDSHISSNMPRNTLNYISFSQNLVTNEVQYSNTYSYNHLIRIVIQ